MAATSMMWSSAHEAASRFSLDLATKLAEIRQVDQGALEGVAHPSQSGYGSLAEVLAAYAAGLRAGRKSEEADILDIVDAKIQDPPSRGGLGLRPEATPSREQYEEAVFLVDVWLESLNSRERAPQKLSVAPSRSAKPMTLAQKIFSQHCLGAVPAGGLAAGDVVRVSVDWILASELSWAGMERTYQEMGAPGIWRNDRFWLAGDHIVHPAINQTPKIKSFIDKAEAAKKNLKMVDYQGMNYTIMHTEFVRERAEPGMLCIGSDSHSCSAGAVGCLSIGLGTADVMMTLALGETWFKVPESILIEVRGKPHEAISGKDVIMHILKEFKRNTVAAERIVEFAGEGLQHLSCDDRFAIANMCTEFGAVTGVFVPDAVTKSFIDKRRRKMNKSSSLYFKPDPEAQYAGRYTIDLSQVEPSIAVYPNPDHVVPVSEMSGTKLDGVFIGACTTTEEELVLAALVLKAGLEKKLPLAKGKRHYVPGSLPIVERLRELGLLDIYEAAGFTRGPPGCSYCVGLSAEKAAPGETWLSSQNRNFKNRMGPGSFGHVTSAIVCAASSFDMMVTSPLDLLQHLDRRFLERYRATEHGSAASVTYVEPDLQPLPTNLNASTAVLTPPPSASGRAPELGVMQSRIARLGDFIDTDALAPGEILTSCVTDEEFGEHVLKHTHPDFRAKVKNGHEIVVAGNAFGVGSSRECAVSALKGAGVQAVIAKSFAFIYQRNQPSLGLLGFTVADDAFYDAAQDGQDIEIDVPRRKVIIGEGEWPFTLSNIEYNLTINQGIAESFKKYGKSIWNQITKAEEPAAPVPAEHIPTDARLQW